MITGAARDQLVSYGASANCNRRDLNTALDSVESANRELEVSSDNRANPLIQAVLNR
jgi:hypothetical protein